MCGYNRGEMSDSVTARAVVVFKTNGCEHCAWVFVPRRLQDAIQYAARLCSATDAHNIVSESVPCMQSNAFFSIIFLPSAEGYNETASRLITNLEGSPRSCFAHILMCRCTDGVLSDLEYDSTSFEDCVEAWQMHHSMPNTWDCVLHY